MLNRERYIGYAKQANFLFRDDESLYGLTPTQARRGKHKQFSRKNHLHYEGRPCARCRPLPKTPAPIG